MSASRFAAPDHRGDALLQLVDHVLGVVPNCDRLIESYDVERHLMRPMNWLTMKWVGSADRDHDLHAGMETTLARIKAAAEGAG